MANMTGSSLNCAKCWTTDMAICNVSVDHGVNERTFKVNISETMDSLLEIRNFHAEQSIVSSPLNIR